MYFDPQEKLYAIDQWEDFSNFPFFATFYDKKFSNGSLYTCSIFIVSITKINTFLSVQDF